MWQNMATLLCKRRRTHAHTRSREGQNPLWKYETWKNKNYILWGRHQTTVSLCSQDNNRKVLSKWQNDAGCSPQLSLTLYLLLQHRLKQQSLSSHPNKNLFWQYISSFLWTKLIENNICARPFACTQWGKASFTFIHATAVCALTYYPSCLFSALQRLSAWSFILMKWAELEAKGRSE